ncbi:MAG TPA: hypothetical protein VLA09_02775 [Longimicrobiales bacterium]|nr:hypothetical protein [Longimicrobiales bacterium]
MRFDLAHAGDDEALRALFRANPMDGDVRVTLEREPSFFLASSIEGHGHQTIVARRESGAGLLGAGSRAVITAFVNGEPRSVGYLSQLRIDQDQPSRRRLLAGGYRKLRELHGDGQVAFYLTTIVRDNRPARRFLEAGLAGLPVYRRLDDVVTLVLPTARPSRRARRLATGAEVRAATPGRLPAIVGCLQRNGRRYQFARCWGVADIEDSERTRGLEVEDFLYVSEGGAVRGCVAVWDQRAFKQTVVRSFSPWLRRVRPAFNVVAPLLRQPRLPSPGRTLGTVFASHLAVDDDRTDIVVALLEEARTSARRRGADYLVLGLARRHPLLEPVKRLFDHREYVSVLYQVFWEKDAPGLPEVGELVPHVEVATL